MAKMNNTSKYVKAFIAEAQEGLQEMNRALLELEKAPGKRGLLDEMFRRAHTIKGGAASMGYAEISALAHEMESLMDKLRGRSLKPDPPAVDILFEALDLLEMLVEGVVKQEKREIEITPVIDKIKAVSVKGPESNAKLEKNVLAAGPGLPGVSALGKTQTVRVDIARLDKLMNLVGELVIDKIRLIRIGTIHEIPELTETAGHLDRLIADIQYEVMQARLVPVDLIFNRFPRMVRDLARTKKKKIDLIIKGTEIEVDRSILDRLSDPLIHMLRNAVDHGIEPASERKKAGKPEAGSIVLAAERQKEHVVIEVSDNGRGIEPDRILDAAIKKGLTTPEVELDDKEKLMLIFTPGLSTHKEATDVSGRGVGMDVVKKTTESLGGTVTIDSNVGTGTKFTLKLPLTTAIARGLLVKVREETFVVPLAGVREIVSVKAKDIETIKGQEAILIRGEIVPLVPLDRVLEFDLCKKTKAEFFALVVEAGSKRAALVVDCLLGQQEIVIKPLEGYLKGVKGYAGNTILGDGKAAFILDVPSLVESK